MKALTSIALVGISLFSLAQPPSANAGVIFSDFGPGNTYSADSGWPVFGSASAFNVGAVAQAMEFTSSGNFSLSQIDLGLTWDSGTNSADVSLWTNVGGVPGLQLGPTWTVSGQPAFTSTGNTITTISGITGVNLISGDTYFLVIGPGAADTADVWNINSNRRNGTQS